MHHLKELPANLQRQDLTILLSMIQNSNPISEDVNALK
jgi:hypothetical protein